MSENENNLKLNESLQAAWLSGYSAGLKDNFKETEDLLDNEIENVELRDLDDFLQAEKLNYKKNESLKAITKRNKFGSCNYFCVPNNSKELQQLITFLNNNEIEYFIIGDTSNIYFLESLHYDVIISTKKLRGIKFDDNSVTCESGYKLTKLAKELVDKGVLNYLGFIGIPGTVGGAAVNNSGAFNCEMSKVVKEITLLNADNEMITLTNQELEFSERNSVLKSKKISGCVMSVTFDTSVLGDVDLLQKQMEQLISHRRGYIDSDKISLGSVFVSASYGHLKKKYAYRLFIKKVVFFIWKQFIRNSKGRRKLNKILEFQALGLSRFIDHCDTLNRFYWTKDTSESVFFDYLNTLEHMSDNTLRIEIEMKGDIQEVQKQLPFYPDVSKRVER